MIPFDLEDWYRIEPEIDQEARAIDNRTGRTKFLISMLTTKKNWEEYTPDRMSNRDDLFVEFVFLHAIQKYGLDVTAKEIAEEWMHGRNCSRNGHKRTANWSTW